MDSSRTKRFYNGFALFYPLVDIFLKPQKKKLVTLLNALPPGYLLEIGVGTGSHFKHYKNHTIQAIDVSEGMLQKAAKNTGNSNIHLQLMDGENLTFPANNFDYIVICHTIAVTHNPDKMLAEAHRVLKPGGLLYILNHDTPDNTLGYIDRGFNSIAKLFRFKSHFKLLALQGLSGFKNVGVGDFGFFGYFKLFTFKK